MDFTKNDLKSTDLTSAAQQRFTQALSDANALRADGLAMLVHGVQAHVDSLAFEHKRLSAKYGAESAQARAAAQTLMIAQDRQPLIEAENVRTKLTPPKVNPDAAVLYGRILTADHAGAAGASIVLSTSSQDAAADGGEQRPANYEAKTNADGEFVFTLRPQKDTVTFTLEITSAKGGKAEVQDSAPFAAGTVTYREYLI